MSEMCVFCSQQVLFNDFSLTRKTCVCWRLDFKGFTKRKDLLRYTYYYNIYMCKENSEKLNVFEQIEDVTCITNWLEKRAL